MWGSKNKVKDHEKNPRNVGVIENPDAEAVYGDVTRDAVKVTLKIDSEKKIQEVKFQTFGSSKAIASSSVLSELILGKTIGEAKKITDQDIFGSVPNLSEETNHESVKGRLALLNALDSYGSSSFAPFEFHGEIGNAVCTCFGVTALEIREVIRENDLKEINEVTNACKAGGGCETCHPDIEGMLDEWQRMKT